MTTCPSSQTLKQLLEAELTGPLAQAISDHVDGCPACQTVLEELSDDAGLRPWKPAAETPKDGPPTGPGLARVLERARLSTGLGATPVADMAACPDGGWPFLEPPRRPEDLGSLGPYAIEAELGRGGMGIVLRGYDAALERRVAIKVLRPGLNDEKARARFVREAQAAARVRHDHVVSVHAVASPPGGLPYLVMELLDGATLAERIRQRQHLEPGEAAQLALQAADGLHAAHQAGLVHRDVKPGNLLLDAATGRVKLTDFGLARSTELSSGVTQEGMVVGTPAYMSPEQARGAAADPRSDVYSLGATLYEMLTGAPPFHGAPHLVLRQVLTEEPRRPRRLNDAIPRDLETICLKALAKEPERRYRTAGELADDLRRFLRGEPVRARPAGRVERLRRWCRRKPLVAGLAAALLLTAVAGIVAVVWQWRRAEAHAAEAQYHAGEARQEREVAEARFQLARKAVDRFFDRIYREGWLNQPGMQAQRREVLEELLQYYREFVQQRRDDPRGLEELASAYFNIGRIVEDTGDKAQALASYREALQLFEALAAAEPGNKYFVRRAMQCHDRIGEMLWNTGRSQEALASYEQSLRLLEQAGPDTPNEVLYRRNLGAAYGSLANMHMLLRHSAEARAYYEKALRLQEQLVAEHAPDYSNALICLGRTYNNLGTLLNGTPEGLRYHQKARAVREELVRLEPKSAFARRDLARSLYWSAVILESQGRVDQALADMDQAVTHLRRAVAAEPESTRYSNDLAEAFSGRGELYHKTGRHTEALRDYQEAAPIWERLIGVSPSVPDYPRSLAAVHGARAEVYRAQGKPAEALAALRQAVRLREGLVRAHPGHAEDATELARMRESIERLERELAGMGTKTPGP
jgi:tetratricopeptide (TPR) repeat protein/tRNA A-37 threonylcarbamoyl transferase component Bud32